jgi:hypothetical protein
MGTVMNNHGTVLEHVVLSCALEWAVQVTREDHVPEKGRSTIQYIDSHAMAPMNRPVPPIPPYLPLTRLLTPSRLPAVAPAVPGMVYRQALHSAAPLQQNGQSDCYPTHFIHAALAAMYHKCRLEAYLFENNENNENEDRRAEIAAFIQAFPNVVQVGLVPNALMATLAPEPGDWQDRRNWPPVAERSGHALLVFNDPYSFDRDDGAHGHMDAASLRWMRCLINDRFQSRPNLTVNAIFLTANLGVNDPNGYQNYAQDVCLSWVENFVPEQAVCRACRCVKWGAFMVLVGAYLMRGTTWDLQAQFGSLCRSTVEAIEALGLDCGGPKLLP